MMTAANWRAQTANVIDVNEPRRLWQIEEGKQ